MFEQRTCYTRSIAMVKFIAFSVAQLCAGIASLRAQEVLDPDVTRIDVRMEGSPETAALETSEASIAGRVAVQPSAFLSNGGAQGAAFERKTQAPLVWLNLHKSTLHASHAPLSSDAAVSTDGGAHPVAFLDVAASPLDSIVDLMQAAPVQLPEPSEGLKQQAPSCEKRRALRPRLRRTSGESSIRFWGAALRRAILISKMLAQSHSYLLQGKVVRLTVLTMGHAVASFAASRACRMGPKFGGVRNAWRGGLARVAREISAQLALGAGLPAMGVARRQRTTWGPVARRPSQATTRRCFTSGRPRAAHIGHAERDV